MNRYELRVYREFQYRFWKGLGLFWVMDKLGLKPLVWIQYRLRRDNLLTNRGGTKRTERPK